jgi:hypothetical protein
MRLLPLLAIIPAIFLSCEKEKDLKQTCFKARYVATGCNDVIQLLEPIDKRLPTSDYWGYENAIGTVDLPAAYKNGQPFYFTVKKIEPVKFYLAYCTPTKHCAEIENLSSAACGQ